MVCKDPSAQPQKRGDPGEAAEGRLSVETLLFPKMKPGAYNGNLNKSIVFLMFIKTDVHDISKLKVRKADFALALLELNPALQREQHSKLIEVAWKAVNGRKICSSNHTLRTPTVTTKLSSVWMVGARVRSCWS